MGAAGTRFGRNVPLSEAAPDTERLLTPNPREVSRELLTRTRFEPATIVNVLAAAWIQFQVHDWLQHPKGSPTDVHEIPLADGDPWPEPPMRVPRTPADPATAGMHWLLETKGAETPEVKRKDEAASRWCQAATELTSVTWKYMKVAQKQYEQLQAATLGDLAILHRDSM